MLRRARWGNSITAPNGTIRYAASTSSPAPPAADATPNAILQAQFFGSLPVQECAIVTERSVGCNVPPFLQADVLSPSQGSSAAGTVLSALPLTARLFSLRVLCRHSHLAPLVVGPFPSSLGAPLRPSTSAASQDVEWPPEQPMDFEDGLFGESAAESEALLASLLREDDGSDELPLGNTTIGSSASRPSGGGGGHSDGSSEQQRETRDETDDAFASSLTAEAQAAQRRLWSAVVTTTASGAAVQMPLVSALGRSPNLLPLASASDFADDPVYRWVSEEEAVVGGLAELVGGSAEHQADSHPQRAPKDTAPAPRARRDLLAAVPLEGPRCALLLDAAAGEPRSGTAGAVSLLLMHAKGAALPAPKQAPPPAPPQQGLLPPPASSSAVGAAMAAFVATIAVTHNAAGPSDECIGGGDALPGGSPPCYTAWIEDYPLAPHEGGGRDADATATTQGGAGLGPKSVVDIALRYAVQSWRHALGLCAIAHAARLGDRRGVAVAGAVAAEQSERLLLGDAADQPRASVDVHWRLLEDAALHIRGGDGGNSDAYISASLADGSEAAALNTLSRAALTNRFVFACSHPRDVGALQDATGVPLVSARPFGGRPVRVLLRSPYHAPPMLLPDVAVAMARLKDGATAAEVLIAAALAGTGPHQARLHAFLCAASGRVRSWRGGLSSPAEWPRPRDECLTITDPQSQSTTHGAAAHLLASSRKPAAALLPSSFAPSPAHAGGGVRDTILASTDMHDLQADVARVPSPEEQLRTQLVPSAMQLCVAAGRWHQAVNLYTSLLHRSNSVTPAAVLSLAEAVGGPRRQWWLALDLLSMAATATPAAVAATTEAAAPATEGDGACAIPNHLPTASSGTTVAVSAAEDPSKTALSLPGKEDTLAEPPFAPTLIATLLGTYVAAEQWAQGLRLINTVGVDAVAAHPATAAAALRLLLIVPPGRMLPMEGEALPTATNQGTTNSSGADSSPLLCNAPVGAAGGGGQRSKPVHGGAMRVWEGALFDLFGLRVGRAAEARTYALQQVLARCGGDAAVLCAALIHVYADDSAPVPVPLVPDDRLAYDLLSAPVRDERHVARLRCLVFSGRSTVLDALLLALDACARHGRFHKALWLVEYYKPLLQPLPSLDMVTVDGAHVRHVPTAAVSDAVASMVMDSVLRAPRASLPPPHALPALMHRIVTAIGIFLGPPLQVAEGAAPLYHQYPVPLSPVPALDGSVVDVAPLPPRRDITDSAAEKGTVNVLRQFPGDQSSIRLFNRYNYDVWDHGVCPDVSPAALGLEGTDPPRPARFVSFSRDRGPDELASVLQRFERLHHFILSYATLHGCGDVCLPLCQELEDPRRMLCPSAVHFSFVFGGARPGSSPSSAPGGPVAALGLGPTAVEARAAFENETRALKPLIRKRLGAMGLRADAATEAFNSWMRSRMAVQMSGTRPLEAAAARMSALALLFTESAMPYIVTRILPPMHPHGHHKKDRKAPHMPTTIETFPWQPILAGVVTDCSAAGTTTRKGAVDSNEAPPPLLLPLGPVPEQRAKAGLPSTLTGGVPLWSPTAKTASPFPSVVPLAGPPRGVHALLDTNTIHTHNVSVPVPRNSTAEYSRRLRAIGLPAPRVYSSSGSGNVGGYVQVSRTTILHSRSLSDCQLSILCDLVAEAATIGATVPRPTTAPSGPDGALQTTYESPAYVQFTLTRDGGAPLSTRGAALTPDEALQDPPPRAPPSTAASGVAAAFHYYSTQSNGGDGHAPSSAHARPPEVSFLRALLASSSNSASNNKRRSGGSALTTALEAIVHSTSTTTVPTTPMTPAPAPTQCTGGPSLVLPDADAVPLVATLPRAVTEAVFSRLLGRSDSKTDTVTSITSTRSDNTAKAGYRHAIRPLASVPAQAAAAQTTLQPPPDGEPLPANLDPHTSDLRPCVAVRPVTAVSSISKSGVSPPAVVVLRKPRGVATAAVVRAYNLAHQQAAFPGLQRVPRQESRTTGGDGRGRGRGRGGVAEGPAADLLDVRAAYEGLAHAYRPLVVLPRHAEGLLPVVPIHRGLSFGSGSVICVRAAAAPIERRPGTLADVSTTRALFGRFRLDCADISQTYNMRMPTDVNWDDADDGAPQWVPFEAEIALAGGCASGRRAVEHFERDLLLCGWAVVGSAFVADGDVGRVAGDGLAEYFYIRTGTEVRGAADSRPRGGSRRGLDDEHDAMDVGMVCSAVRVVTDQTYSSYAIQEGKFACLKQGVPCVEAPFVAQLEASEVEEDEEV